MTIYSKNEPIAARRKFTFVCVDDTDGKTPELGLTFSSDEVALRKAGLTSYTAVANIAIIVEIGDGEYEGEFTASELSNDGPLMLKIKKTGVRTTILSIGQVASDLFGEVRRGLAQGGSATTTTLDTGASAASNFYVGNFISIVEGLGAGATRLIIGYVGASRVATVEGGWPGLGTDNTSVFVIHAGDHGHIRDSEITSAKIATNAIHTSALAAGAVHVTAIANNAIGASQIASNAITSAKIAANAIGSSQIAANAITSSQLDATAVAEIADAVWDEARAGHVTAGTFGEQVNANVTKWVGNGVATPSIAGVPEVDITHLNGNVVQHNVGYFKSDVVLWNGITPNALASGRVDASVGAMAAGVVTAAAIATDAIDADALAADAVAEIQSGLATSSDTSTLIGMVGVVAADTSTIRSDTDDIQSRLPAALVGGRMDSSVGVMETSVLTADALASEAVTEIQSGLATQSDAFDIAGLLHRNAMIDNVVHDGNGFMTSARLRIFSDAAALATASAGAADDADGEVSRYTLTGTAASNLLSSFKAGKTL